MVKLAIESRVGLVHKDTSKTLIVCRAVGGEGVTFLDVKPALEALNKDLGVLPNSLRVISSSTASHVLSLTRELPSLPQNQADFLNALVTVGPILTDRLVVSHDNAKNGECAFQIVDGVGLQNTQHRSWLVYMKGVSKKTEKPGPFNKLVKGVVYLSQDELFVLDSFFSPEVKMDLAEGHIISIDLSGVNQNKISFFPIPSYGWQKEAFDINSFSVSRGFVRCSEENPFAINFLTPSAYFMSPEVRFAGKDSRTIKLNAVPSDRYSSIVLEADGLDPLFRKDAVLELK